jgi:hypothetical protein
MSIQSLYPSIAPSLNLDFANAKTLDPRIGFTRASEGRVYDGKTFAKAEENLLLRSQDFTTTWSYVGATATANTTAAPDGTTTADTLAETATTETHFTTATAVATGVLTFSVFAKPNAGTPFLTIGLNRDATHYCSATFDLGLGTNTLTQAAGNYTGASATITAASQGFFRCTLTVTTDGTTLVRIGLNNTGTPTSLNRGFGATYLGVVTNSIFLWGAQLEQRASVTAYTPTTTQPITNYIPVLQTAAANVARFDHNPVTGESLGLLIEEQRTNLLLRSEEFDDAYWNKVRATITANTIVAPSGMLTADKVVENTELGSHYTARSIAYTSGTTYTLSVYAKAAEKSVISMGLPGGAFTSNRVVIANLSAGTISTTGTPEGSGIQSVGNGWYRVWVTHTATSTASVTTVVAGLGNSYIESYTGDGFSGICIWGAQLEAGSFPTSYIPTEASQATRNADAASMTGANFSSWYRADEGSLYFEGGIPSNYSAGFQVLYSLNDTTVNNNIQPAVNAAGDVINVEMKVGNSVVAGFYPAYTSGAAKLVFAYKVNDVNFALNSVSGTTDTTATVPVVSQLNFGTNQSGGNVLNGHIRKLAYYPQRLTNSQLTAITS